MIDQNIIKNVTRQVKEVCISLQPLDPIQILNRACFESAFQHLGKETESSIGLEQIHSQFLIEYLQSIFLSIDLSKNLRSPTQNEWKEIKKKIVNIYDTCRMVMYDLTLQRFRHLKGKSKQREVSTSEEDTDLFFKILSSWLIRGDRYPKHESEHLTSMLEPHNEILKELYQITAKEIAMGVEKLLLNAQFFLDIFEKSLQNKIKETQKEIKNLEEDLFNVEKITQWPISFIKKFSAYPGSDKLFLTTGKYPGTPFQRLPIMKKPFFEYNSKFYLFSPYALQDLYRNIQFSILEDKPDYSDEWNKRQSSISEELPFEILKKIIGQYDQIRNFQYKIRSYPSSQSWFECDGIILFENWLFVIEVKAGKASYQPPIQNIDSHIEAVKKLLAEPANQGRRFIETLKKEKEIKLYNKKKGDVVKTISIDDFKESVVMAVSLEQLTDISSQIQNFKRLNLDRKGVEVLCISIDDLRTYRDLSNGVIEFFHFLTERKKAFYNSDLTLDDELDHFGMYLKYNQYHDITEDMPKTDLNVFGGYRDEIDRYFQLSFLYPEREIEKPKQNIPEFLEDILTNLEVKRKPGFIRTGIIFCSLSSEAQDKMNKDFLNALDLQRKQRKIRPSFVLLDDLSVSIIIRSPGIQPDFIPKDYATRNVFIQEKGEGLLLDIFLDEKDRIKDVSFEWIKRENLNEEEVRRYKKEAKQFADFRFHNQMKYRNKKKIGGNEKCPCGSGKEYNKCHGLRL